MRIVDTDVLLKNLEWLDEYDYIVFNEIKRAIDKTPTVDAIPIEWIEKFIDNDILSETVKILLNAWEWEKENES